MIKNPFLTLIILFFAFSGSVQSQPKPFTAAMKKGMCDKVREACRHAWKGYKQYAWGMDDLRPLTKEGRNWYKTSLLMTPVDAFDTFIMLGMKKEAAEAKELILSKLSFDVDNEVVGEQATSLFADAQEMLQQIVSEKWLTAKGIAILSH